MGKTPPRLLKVRVANKNAKERKVSLGAMEHRSLTRLRAAKHQHVTKVEACMPCDNLRSFCWGLRKGVVFLQHSSWNSSWNVLHGLVTSGVWAGKVPSGGWHSCQWRHGIQEEKMRRQKGSQVEMSDRKLEMWDVG